MRFFPNTSIQRKQKIIITLTSSVVLLLACAAFVTYDAIAFREELVESVSILAEAVGSNCAAAIDYSDPETAGETLGALRANENIVAACVYSADGAAFAVYNRAGGSQFNPPVKREAGEEFTDDQLQLFRPIMQKGEMIGTIFVASDLKDLASRLTRYLSIVALVFVASLLIALALSSMLQRLVSDPILHLAQVARSVALEKNYSVRATKQSNDELGQLVDGFNDMLAQIQERDIALQTARDDREKRSVERAQELEIIHKQLLEASRRGGMAEIATNVLHNVGNVLNSVNVSAGLIIERVKESRVSNLGKVAALLHEHANDLGEFLTSDPRGKLVPAHLAQLSEHLISRQEAIITELGSLQQNIAHIKDIVAMQQSYAMVGGVKEMTSVVSLAEDSLRMNESALGRHHVEVFREYETVPPMNVEKHKILQILVNLVRNAKYACDESDIAEKRLTMRVVKNATRVLVSVIDNGVGIASEDMVRIFNHGFTTRKGGHGFGLHSSALAAREMNGSLTAYSDGPGRGATFTLELPYSTNENPDE